MLNSIQTVLIILLLLFVGWFMAWKGWFLKEHKSFVIKLIVNISVPSMAIINFFDSFPRDMLFSSGMLLLMPLITILICFALANVVAKVIKIQRLRRGSFLAMCTVSNSIFIGLPVCQGLFGEISTPYVMFYYIVNTIIFWGICNPRIREDGEGKAIGLRDVIHKVLNVPLITVLFCSILLFIGFRPPILILRTAKYLGSMVTPLSLILAGKVIHETGIKNIKLDLSIFIIMIMRFLLAPAITFFMCRAVGVPMIAAQVFTIQAAMPVMIQTTVSAEAYGTDSSYVAAAVSITTIASLLFIPLYMEIMPLLW